LIEETYKIVSTNNKKLFFFQSIGTIGVISKAVVFQEFKGKINLAFGDLKDGNIDDKSISGNQDISKVLSTVAKCVYEFLKAYPDSIIIIKPVDEKRRQFYNLIIKRRIDEIKQNFQIWGIFEGQIEDYNPGKQYDAFEIKQLSKTEKE